MLKYILLGFLNYRPMTGYEIKTRMDSSTGHFWHAYHSQIYTTLGKLEDQGLLTSEMEEGHDNLNRRTYTLTEKGRAELEEWLNTPLTERVPVKEELVVRLFFSASRDRAAVIDELRFQRHLHQQKLDDYRNLQGSPHHQLVTENPAEVEQDIPFWLATLQFGVEYELLYIKWLDETIRMIEGLPS